MGSTGGIWGQDCGGHGGDAGETREGVRNKRVTSTYGNLYYRLRRLPGGAQTRMAFIHTHEKQHPY